MADPESAVAVTDLDRLNRKLCELLDLTAVALYGPGQNYDWSDLPTKAAHLRFERDALYAQNKRVYTERAKRDKRRGG